MYKIYLDVYGCSNNISEAEVMLGLLQNAGFKIVKHAKNSNLVIISLCSVKGDSKPLKIVRDYLLLNKKIIVAGCLNKDLIKEIKELNSNISFVSTHNIKNIVKAVKSAINDEPQEFLYYSNPIKINLPKVRKNKLISIIPISQGCLNECTYCSVRLIKGKLKSYSKEKIIHEVKTSLNQNCKEVWITSQDTANYQTETNQKSQLVNLLQKIIKTKGDFKIRIGMMNPQYILPILDELIELYKNDKIYKFLHIPVQSGSDKILKLMKRNYSKEDYIKIISKFKQEIPEITISTDIIVGFPQETEEDFNQSITLIKETKPNILNLSRFIPRKGTLAATYKQIPSWQIKERSKKLNKIFTEQALENNKDWLGWFGEILINELGKNNTFIGRNYAYKPIIIANKVKLGSKAKVKINKVTCHDFRSELT